jgi:hypothetical protein
LSSFVGESLNNMTLLILEEEVKKGEDGMIVTETS